VTNRETPGGVDDVITRLRDARRREKAMTLFYRAAAAEAEQEGRSGDSERLNELHADEQHHLSRLTARLLELGATPGSLQEIVRPEVDLGRWEQDARAREADEVEYYRAWLDEGIGDAATREVVAEILESEVHHHRDLGGKWMPAN
jgi:rubrerythrin